MSRIIKSLGVGVWVGMRHSKNPKWSDQVQLNVRGFQRCGKLLKKIIPHLKLKREQALLLEDYIEYRSKMNCKQPCGEMENGYWRKLQQLNEKGKRFNDYTPETKKGHDIV
jgi:hypothetical protein